MSADRHIGATLGPGHPGSSGWRKKLQGPPSLANPSRAPHARGSLLSSSAQAAWPERGLSCHRDGMLATPDGPWLRGAFTCRVEKVWLPRGRGSLAEGHRGCLEGRIVSEGLGGMGEGEAQLHDDKDPSSWTPSFRIVCGTWQGLLERRWAAPSYPHPEPGGMQGPGHYFLRGKKSDSPKKPTPQTSWLSETPGEDVALLRGGLSSTKPSQTQVRGRCRACSSSGWAPRPRASAFPQPAQSRHGADLGEQGIGGRTDDGQMDG